MATQSLSRVTFDGKGGATAAERWAVGHRVRDVVVGPDGVPSGCSRTPTPAGCSA